MDRVEREREFHHVEGAGVARAVFAQLRNELAGAVGVGGLLRLLQIAIRVFERLGDLLCLLVVRSDEMGGLDEAVLR